MYAPVVQQLLFAPVSQAINWQRINKLVLVSIGYIYSFSNYAVGLHFYSCIVDIYLSSSNVVI